MCIARVLPFKLNRLRWHLTITPSKVLLSKTASGMEVRNTAACGLKTDPRVRIRAHSISALGYSGWHARDRERYANRSCIGSLCYRPPHHRPQEVGKEELGRSARRGSMRAGQEAGATHSSLPKAGRRCERFTFKWKIPTRILFFHLYRYRYQ